MIEKQEKKVRAYTGREEFLHALIHGIGVALSIAALGVLVTISAYHKNVWAVVSCAIFGTSLILMYSMSTVYHSIQNENAKKYSLFL